MPKLVRYSYNRQAIDDARSKGLPLPEPEAIEVLGDAEYDEYDLYEVAGIFYREMKELKLF